MANLIVMFTLLWSSAAFASPALDAIDALIRQGNIEDARTATEKRLREHPKDVETWIRLSRVQVLLGDSKTKGEDQLALYEQAKITAEKAISLDEKNMMGYLRRAVANGKIALFKGVLQTRELVLQTREDAQKALQLGGNNPYGLGLAHYILGRTHLKLSETPKALRVPLGLQWGNLKEAVEHLSKSVAAYPASVAFRTDYARALIKSGDSTQAKEQLDAADNLPDSDPGDAKKRSEILELRGELKK